MINNSMAKFRGFSTVEKLRPSYNVTGVELVKRDLLNTFYTKRGERVMRPNYGSAIWDHLMDPSTAELDSIVKADIKKILSAEPRVQLVDLQVYVMDYTISAEITLKFLPGGQEDSLYLNYVREIEQGIE